MKNQSTQIKESLTYETFSAQYYIHKEHKQVEKLAHHTALWNSKNAVLSNIVLYMCIQFAHHIT